MYVVLYMLLCVNLVMNLSCIFSLFVYELLMGVKASLTFGREEMPWVKGLVGLNSAIEKIFSWREGSFYGVWAPL